MRVTVAFLVVLAGCATAQPPPPPILPAAMDVDALVPQGADPPPLEIPTDVVRFAPRPIEEGDVSPFPGILIDEADAAKFRSGLNELERVRAHLAALRALRASERAAYESLAARLDEAAREAQAARARAEDWKPWMFAGGVVIGALAAVAIAYAVSGAIE